MFKRKEKHVLIIKCYISNKKKKTIYYDTKSMMERVLNFMKLNVKDESLFE